MAKNKKNQPLDQALEAVTQTPEPLTTSIIKLDDERLQIEDTTYQLLINYGDGFQLDALAQRYQPYFETFDYIVGDWAFDQLRLRGFYQLNRRRVPKDQTIDFLDDYLKEYCNFGAAYFVIAKESVMDNYADALAKYRHSRDKKASFQPRSRRRSVNTKSRRNRQTRSRSTNKGQQRRDRFKIKQKGESK